jgi:hypothetical protein
MCMYARLLIQIQAPWACIVENMKVEIKCYDFLANFVYITSCHSEEGYTSNTNIYFYPKTGEYNDQGSFQWQNIKNEDICN